jgi:integrase
MPIRKDAQGRWHAEVCINRQRLHRRLPEGASAGDAKELEAELRRAVRVNPRAPVVPGNPLLTEVIGHYAKHHGPLLKGWSRSRWAAYRLGPWIDGQRASDTRAVCARIIEDMLPAYAPATINKSLGILSKALSLAWDRGETEQDYSRMVRRLPENNHRDRVLTLQEVQRIADQASSAVRAAVWICLYTGLRRGEVCALRPGNVDLKAGLLTVPAGMAKSQRIRTVPIATPARPWLEQVPVGITPQGFRSGWDRAREKAGIPDATIHDLRRSCGTMLIRAGVDLYVVSKILGHSSTTVTQARYAHLATKQLKAGIKKAFG